VKNRDDAVLSSALSFGDVNGDGYLDAAIGNWAAGYGAFRGAQPRDLQRAGRPGEILRAPGMPGETLDPVQRFQPGRQARPDRRQ
jgi:hypothetical protein